MSVYKVLYMLHIYENYEATSLYLSINITRYL